MLIKNSNTVSFIQSFIQFLSYYLKWEYLVFKNPWNNTVKPLYSLNKNSVYVNASLLWFVTQDKVTNHKPLCVGLVFSEAINLIASELPAYI